MANDDVVRSLREARAARGLGPGNPPTLPPAGPGGTSGDMDRIWAKLDEHERRFDRLDSKLDRLADEVGNAKLWFVGTVTGIVLAGLALVYTARQDTTATIGAALTAIQTALAAKPSEPPAPQQPTVIVVPWGSQPAAQRPTETPAPSMPQAPR